MRPRSEEMRDALSAEYALGTLRGRARQRFQRWLASDARLRRRVEVWQERLVTLDEDLEPVQPQRRVWANIERRIGAAPVRGGLWNSLGFWRGATFASTLAALGLMTLLAVTRAVAPEDTMVVVMQDDGAGSALDVGRKTRTVPPAIRRVGQRDQRLEIVGRREVRGDESHHAMRQFSTRHGPPIRPRVVSRPQRCRRGNCLNARCVHGTIADRLSSQRVPHRSRC